MVDCAHTTDLEYYSTSLTVPTPTPTPNHTHTHTHTHTHALTRVHTPTVTVMQRLSDCNTTLTHIMLISGYHNVLLDSILATLCDNQQHKLTILNATETQTSAGPESRLAPYFPITATVAHTGRTQEDHVTVKWLFNQLYNLFLNLRRCLYMYSCALKTGYIWKSKKRKLFELYE